MDHRPNPRPDPLNLAAPSSLPRRANDVMSGLSGPHFDPRPEARKPDWMLLLIVLVITVALAVGWLLGRSGSEQTGVTIKPAPAIPSAAEPPPVLLPLPASAPAGDSMRVYSSRKKNPADEASRGGLVIYQNGKVIFRQQPAQHLADARPSATAPAPATQDSADPGPVSSGESPQP